jgi:acyl-coenzyme A synthetase/AMP-(fatty) acid ligase
VAYVIPAIEPATADRLQDLLDRLNQRCVAELSRFKVPEAIYVVQDLPRAATGKVQRHRISADLGGTAPQTPYAGFARVAQGAPAT